jgi:protein SCO1
VQASDTRVPRAPAPGPRSGWRALGWGLLIGAAALAWPAAVALRSRDVKPAPVLFQVPSFTLSDQNGQPFGSADLDGKVWVASFIFTRCVTVCPVITEKMARIQGRARGLDGFRLVSVSVDPDYDTPERLAEYARQHRADPRTWRFLTGPSEVVLPLVQEGFKAAVEDGGTGGLVHDTRLLIVDRRGRVRQIYDSDSPDVVQHVVQDAAMLLKRGDEVP